MNSPPPVAAGPTTPPTTPPAPQAACANCGTPLLGEHCYACGQPVKGLVRHFSSLVGDVLDSVFEWDSRTPRTLWPLGWPTTTVMSSSAASSLATVCTAASQAAMKAGRRNRSSAA